MANVLPRDGEPSQARLADFIRANLPLVRLPFLPEIKLHLAVPQSGLKRLAQADRTFGSPYWAHAWGGGLALARYLLDHPEHVADRCVLDLGAGSGLVAIAAAKAGALRVLAADVDPYALTATALNAEANRVQVETWLEDLTRDPVPPVTLVAVGDLFYEKRLARRVTAFLDRCLSAGTDVLIGDPWRAHLPRDRLDLLAEYQVTDFGAVADTQGPAAVFRFISKRA